MKHMPYLFLLPLLACVPNDPAQQDTCAEVQPPFAHYAQRVLTDSTGMFNDFYPPVTPLSCEVLGMLHEELKADSARHFFERFARTYWMEDPHATRTHAYIRRHLSFPLAMAATAHWYADNRIEGLRELQEYRRMRPMVCTTKEHYIQLEAQDRAAVRYFIKVLETTPLYIPGSENATIHSIYMQEVIKTLDLFTGQEHSTTGDMRRTLDMTEVRLQQALTDWRNWLER